MRKLKVWGGLLHYATGQHRAIVAARTKKRALELLAINDNGTSFSKSYFDNYWAETSNLIELSVVNGQEGVWTYKTPGLPGERKAGDLVQNVKWCGHPPADDCECYRAPGY